MPKRKRLSAPDHRNRAVEEQAARLERNANAIRACFAKQVGKMVDADARAALARGELGVFRQSVRRPKPADLISCLIEAARNGWTAGLLESERTIEELVPSVDQKAIVQRVVAAMKSGKKFDDRDIGRLARIREKRAQRNRIEERPAPAELPTSARMKRLLKEESRRMARGMRRVMTTLLENATRDIEDLRAREQAMNAAIEALRRGDESAGRWLDRAALERSDVTGAVSDVDWNHYQSGSIEGYKRDAIIKGWEWVSRRDSKVTCVCEIYDGNVILFDDPDLEMVRPQIHFRDRCNLYPVTVDSTAGATWNLRQNVVVRDRKGNPQSLFVAPRDIAIPATAPNVAPPDPCTDWIDLGRAPEQRRFTTRKQLTQSMKGIQTDLERRFIKQRAERGDEQVRRILKSAGISHQTGSFLFGEPWW